MNTIDIFRNLQRTAKVPVTYYQAGKVLLRRPEIPYLDKLTDHAPAELLINNENVALFANEFSIMYGRLRVRGTEDYVIFGPVCATGCEIDTAQQFLKTLNLPVSDGLAVVNLFQGLQYCSLSRLIALLQLSSSIINQEDIEASSLMPEDIEFTEEPVPTYQSELLNPLDSQQHERLMYTLIYYGRINEMNALVQSEPFGGGMGMLQMPISRAFKNMVICSIAMASRAAVSGGANYESCMRLADNYMQKVEALYTMPSLFNLHRNMLKTYTRMVAESKQNRAESALVSRVHSYIDANINSNLTVESIADALHMNRTYLSSHFKKDTGVNLAYFINKIKMEEACRLLSMTSLSVTDIAAQLSYSSQSHFQAVFKQHLSQTPREYRTSLKNRI